LLDHHTVQKDDGTEAEWLQAFESAKLPPYIDNINLSPRESLARETNTTNQVEVASPHNER